MIYELHLNKVVFKKKKKKKIWLRCPFQRSTTSAWGKWLQGSEKLLDIAMYST